MKIIFKKHEDVREMLWTLSDFLMKQAVDYPLLKEKIEINIELKNSKGQICPDNERVFYNCLGKIYPMDAFGMEFVDQEYSGFDESIEILDERVDEWEKIFYKEEDLNWILMDRWESFIFTHIGNIEYELENDKMYIATAEKRGRSLKNVEKRKKRIEKNEKLLKDMRESKNSLYVFLEKVKKNEVEFRHERDILGFIIKVMIFELRGKKYVFRYASRTPESSNIYDEEGNTMF